MNSGKKKSSGWRDVFKRQTPEQFCAMRAAAAEATARRDCNRRRFWRSCPLRQCQRVARCGGEPLECQERRKTTIAQPRNATLPAAKAAAQTAAQAAPSQQAAAPATSAVEAAAAIKASIAPPLPDPSTGEELVAWYCNGRIEYRPRER